MKCPTCKAKVAKDGNKLFPFCSERCHMVDLGRWLGEEYRIPAVEEEAGDGRGTPPEPESPAADRPAPAPRGRN